MSTSLVYFLLFLIVTASNVFAPPSHEGQYPSQYGERVVRERLSTPGLVISLNVLQQKLNRAISQGTETARALAPISVRTPFSLNLSNELDSALSRIQGCVQNRENEPENLQSTSLTNIQRDLTAALSFEACIQNSLAPMAQKILVTYSPVADPGVCQSRPEHLRNLRDYYPQYLLENR